MYSKVTIEKLILTALKEAYFSRAKKEKIGETAKTTEELDILEIAIKELTETIKNEN